MRFLNGKIPNLDTAKYKTIKYEKLPPCLLVGDKMIYEDKEFGVILFGQSFKIDKENSTVTMIVYN